VPCAIVGGVRHAQELGKTNMKTLMGILAVFVIAAAPTAASAAAMHMHMHHHHHHHHHHMDMVKAPAPYHSDMEHLLSNMFK
jgi:Ni/Co efflux regulator RcnB